MAWRTVHNDNAKIGSHENENMSGSDPHHGRRNGDHGGRHGIRYLWW